MHRLSHNPQANTLSNHRKPEVREGEIQARRASSQKSGPGGPLDFLVFIGHIARYEHCEMIRVFCFCRVLYVCALPYGFLGRVLPCRCCGPCFPKQVMGFPKQVMETHAKYLMVALPCPLHDISPSILTSQNTKNILYQTHKRGIYNYNDTEVMMNIFMHLMHK